MMISCQEASHIMSESMDRPLTLGERFRLRFHLLFCHLCRALESQLDFLRQATDQAGEQFPDYEVDQDVQMPEDLRDRITQNLKSERS